MFLSLDRGRRVDGWGPASLDFQAIESWCRFSGAQLRPWELDIILAMDRARLRNDAHKPETPEEGKTVEVSHRPLTPDLFDSLFPD